MSVVVQICSRTLNTQTNHTTTPDTTTNNNRHPKQYTVCNCKYIFTACKNGITVPATGKNFLPSVKKYFPFDCRGPIGKNFLPSVKKYFPFDCGGPIGKNFLPAVKKYFPFGRRGPTGKNVFTACKKLFTIWPSYKIGSHAVHTPGDE